MSGKKFPAVMVAASASACAAAKAREGRRVLATEAPRLPLPDCSQPQACECRFSKFADRRDDHDGERRHHNVSMRSVLYGGKERRKRGGRRRDD